MSAMATVALGPALGGILTGFAGWRAIFLVNLPLAMVGMLLVLLWIPEDEPRPNGLRRLVHELDFIGIGCFASLLLAGMVFLMSLTHPKWWVLALFVLLGVLLVRHSLRRHEPFINVRMLIRNRALTATYVRFGATNLMVYFMLYGFSQWLQTGPGLSSTKAGLVTLPMSVLGALSALAAGHMKGIRNPLIFGTVGLLFAAGCIVLITSGTSTMLLMLLILPFGLPQGVCSNANQAAVYLQAPHEQIGTAAGLLRTSLYMGAITASSLLGLVFGKRPTDQGLHVMAWMMVGLSSTLVIATLMDRTLPRAATPGSAPSP
jgi:predicted MFS family arabinose efflux permease